MQSFTPSLSLSESSTRMHYRKALEAELSGRLCFNEPNVLRRLQVDAVSDSFCSSCYASIRDDPDLSLHLKTLVALVADAEKPEGHRDEDLMYEPLCAILNHIATYPDPESNDVASGTRAFQINSQADLNSDVHALDIPNLRPGISLLSSSATSTTAGLSSSATSLWRYRMASVEVKATRVQGPYSTRSGSVTRITRQAAHNARLHMSASPFQLFSLVLLVYGIDFCVANFDRAGVTFSPESNLRTPDGWHDFIRIVRCMAVVATPQQLGQDPTVVPFSPPDKEIGMMRADAKMRNINIMDDFPAFSVTLGSEKRRWVTVAMVWSSSSLIGRGTTVWLVRELKNEQVTGHVTIMKTSWRNSARTSESTIYEALKSSGYSHPCVAQYIEGGDVFFPTSPDPTPIRISSLRAAGAVSPEISGDRILHRLLLQSVGRPIWEYTNEKELILGLKAAISGHQYLAQHGILHCDISAGNVLLSSNQIPGQEGFITDLDFAFVSEDSPLAKKVGVQYGQPIMGTYQFTSYRILRAAVIRQQPVSPAIRDDLESFFWVFCYALHRKAVTTAPKNKTISENFWRSFGHVGPFDSCTMRSTLLPAEYIAEFAHVGVSEELAKWFQDRRYLEKGSTFDVFVGFNFSYESILTMLDDALNAIDS